MGYLYERKFFDNIERDKLLIVMDTNVWLDLYDLAPATLELVVEKIKENSKLFWLPHQVYVEFNRNITRSRNAALDRYSNFKDAACKELSDTKGKISGEHNKLKNKGNDETIPLVNYLSNEIDKLIQHIKEIIGPINKTYCKEIKCISKENDVVLNLVNDLYEDSNTNGFKIMELMNIYEEGEKRYRYKISPGYTDASKKETSESEVQFLLRKYGDLIIWKEILRKVSDKEVKLVFVENERKSDWWDKTNIATKNIPIELIQEFDDATSNNSRFSIIDFQEFIYHFGDMFDMPDTSVIEITSKLNFQKSIFKYLDGNKNKIIEDFITEQYENDNYDNPISEKLLDISVYGGSPERIEGFSIDSINILDNCFVNDKALDSTCIKANVQVECFGTLYEYIQKDVFYYGRVQASVNFAISLYLSTDITETTREPKYAFDINDVQIDDMNVLYHKNDEFEIDAFIDEDLLRER